MSEKRNLEHLRNSLDGKIHIYLKDTKTAMQFLVDAENEGFSFGNIKPTACHTSDIIAVEGDNRLAYVTFAGRICFQSNGGNPEKYHRIDYARYKAGDEDYFYTV